MGAQGLECGVFGVYKLRGRLGKDWICGYRELRVQGHGRATVEFRVEEKGGKVHDKVCPHHV